jgi:hypothetical protein
VGRTFWIGYVAGYVLLAVMFGILWLVNPTDDAATAGLSETGGLPPRIGIVLGIMLIPCFLAALRLSKIADRRAASRAVLPILLAVALIFVTYLLGFTPDEVGCFQFNIERFGPLDPDCRTAASVRLGAFVEATLLWILFGALAVGISKLRQRRRRRTVAESEEHAAPRA